MACLVFTSEEDSWIAVASYIGELIDSDEEGSKLVETPGSRFFQECKTSYEAQDFSTLLELFATKLDLLFEKAANDQDLEGSINIICHLVPRIKPPGIAAAAQRLVSALAATPSVRSERRLQALVNLYNVVWDSQSKLTVLLQTLAFSKSSPHPDAMLNVIRIHADTWAKELRLSAEDERTLYVACAEALRACTRKPKTAAKESYRLLCKYLTTFDGATPSEASSGVTVAAQVVSEFVKSSDLYHFDLAESPAVAALAHSTPPHAALHSLLTIYLTGTVADYKAFASSNTTLFESLGMSEEGALTKMRLLALMGLAHGASEITFSEIAVALDIPESEVEFIIVQAIGKKIMEARIDQLKESVTISKCTPRTFGSAQWKELHTRLQSWKDSVQTVLDLGKDEKSVLSNGIAELSIIA